MTTAYRLDWSVLLNRLRARSNTPLTQVGKRVGMCERTINRLARGEIAEPRFSQAMQLLDLAADNLDPRDWHDIHR
jgi:hypothetical protein